MLAAGGRLDLPWLEYVGEAMALLVVAAMSADFVRHVRAGRCLHRAERTGEIRPQTDRTESVHSSDSK